MRNRVRTTALHEYPRTRAGAEDSTCTRVRMGGLRLQEVGRYHIQLLKHTHPHLNSRYSTACSMQDMQLNDHLPVRKSLASLATA